MKLTSLSLLCAAALALPAAAAFAHDAQDAPADAAAAKANPFTATEVARFNEPWAMTFLPNGRLLVTEKRGQLKVLTIGGSAQTITGVPAVAYGGQGGLGDVILHPQFASNGLIYISYAEKGTASGTAGATVARAKLTLTSSGGSLSNLQVLWRQPKVTGSNHYGHRLAFGPDHKLWITSSERQKFDPAQDLNSPLGKVIRLNDDGSVPTDNPFYNRGGVAATVWSYGHRNLLGIAFDAQNKLWIHEMGPAGGDELNLIERGSNYGWPVVSQGDHYDGTPIPRHSTRPDLNAPEAWWTPVIAPAGFVIYSGTRFPAWAGSGLIGGLASQALVRVKFNGNTAAEAERYPMGKRIREVEQGPNGDVWLLEDGTNARLLRLTPI
ncbi:glucose/arabinose dehydrogenase [Lysobacter enzymogenes]|uniref:PQQ-dependent sugar dehydrogenase n=1 Tax=Lysobacter enzymogenes TaxID=69 RepID=UPI00339203A2